MQLAKGCSAGTHCPTDVFATGPVGAEHQPAASVGTGKQRMQRLGVPADQATRVWALCSRAFAFFLVQFEVDFVLSSSSGFFF